MPGSSNIVPWLFCFIRRASGFMQTICICAFIWKRLSELDLSFQTQWLFKAHYNTLETSSWRDENSWRRLVIFLFIALTISFFIGRKRTVNFRNQRLWRHNYRLYNNHVKDTQGHGWSCHVWPRCMISEGNHVKFTRLSVKKQKHGYQPSASADNPYFDLDYSGYHKNLIQ